MNSAKYAKGLSLQVSKRRSGRSLPVGKVKKAKKEEDDSYTAKSVSKFF